MELCQSVPCLETMALKITANGEIPRSFPNFRCEAQKDLLEIVLCLAQRTLSHPQGLLRANLSTLSQVQ